MLNTSMESGLSFLRDIMHKVSENLILNQPELESFINEIFKIKLNIK